MNEWGRYLHMVYMINCGHRWDSTSYPYQRALQYIIHTFKLNFIEGMKSSEHKFFLVYRLEALFNRQLITQNMADRKRLELYVAFTTILCEPEQ